MHRLLRRYSVLGLIHVVRLVGSALCLRKDRRSLRAVRTEIRVRQRWGGVRAGGIRVRVRVLLLLLRILAVVHTPGGALKVHRKAVSRDEA